MLCLSSALKRLNSGCVFPSLQLEYLSWLRGLFLDQYFGHGLISRANFLIPFVAISSICGFHDDSLKSFNNVLLVSSPKFFIMPFVTPSGPGAFLHFNCLIPSSTSSILIASVIQLSAAGWSCFCFSCSMTCLVLSLDSFTLLSS